MKCNEVNCFSSYSEGWICQNFCLITQSVKITYGLDSLVCFIRPKNRKDTLARKTSTNIKRKTIYQAALVFRADTEKIKKTKILFSVKNLSMKKIVGGGWSSLTARWLIFRFRNVQFLKPAPPPGKQKDYKLHVIINGWQPEGHHRAGRRHHHVFWVELNTLHRTFVISIQHTNLLPILRVPDVDPAITGPRDHELGVRGKGSFQGQLLRVEVPREGLQGGAIVGVNQLDNWPVGGDENGLSIRGELQPSPLNFFAVRL